MMAMTMTVLLRKEAPAQNATQSRPRTNYFRNGSTYVPLIHGWEQSYARTVPAKAKVKRTRTRTTTTTKGSKSIWAVSSQVRHSSRATCIPSVIHSWTRPCGGSWDGGGRVADLVTVTGRRERERIEETWSPNNP